MVLLSASSFGYHFCNFQMKYFPGSMYSNIMSSQAAELAGTVAGMFLTNKLDARFAFSSMFALSLFGSALLWVYHVPEG